MCQSKTKITEHIVQTSIPTISIVRQTPAAAGHHYEAISAQPTNGRSDVAVTSPRYRNQLYATLCANLIVITAGTFCGWPAANFPDLMATTDTGNSTSTLLASGALDMDEVSWVGSSISIGAFAGSFVCNWMAQRFGCKRALVASAVPALVRTK